MGCLKISEKWVFAEDMDVCCEATAAQLSIMFGTQALTQNINTWDSRKKDYIIVSTYPLAYWIANSWWRLCYEPRLSSNPPDFGWRMTHELGSADHGFAWPRISFFPDGEVVCIAADVVSMPDQSVTYLPDSKIRALTGLDDFQNELSNFVLRTINRLREKNVAGDLCDLWEILQDEKSDPVCSEYRRIEAALGYDSEEGPNELINDVISLKTAAGDGTIWELSPFIGKQHEFCHELKQKSGIDGNPQLPNINVSSSESPWRRGVKLAHALREHFKDDMVSTTELCDLLGIRYQDVEADNGNFNKRLPVAFASTDNNQAYKFSFRRLRDTGKRFELARFIADLYITKSLSQPWLVSSDLASARQKVQRAFAAEFLCPIDRLLEVLNDDFSEESQTEAAAHFQVSGLTVNSLLRNNGYLSAQDSTFAYAG